jgi:hypothetical protein
MNLRIVCDSVGSKYLHVVAAPEYVLFARNVRPVSQVSADLLNCSQREAASFINVIANSDGCDTARGAVYRLSAFDPDIHGENPHILIVLLLQFHGASEADLSV